MIGTGRARRLGVGALVILSIASSAACSHDPSTLRERAAVTVSSTQVVDASYTAAVPGKRVTLMVPSGRVDLVLTTPQSDISAQQVKSAAPLTAAKGQALVGVSWTLQRAAYPDSPNRQLTEPSAIFGSPQPVHLWLVTDGTSRPIPHVDDLTAPLASNDDRPSNAVWLSVPSGVRTWQFRLDYDGLTQTVDARTGKVDAGRAVPLYRMLPLSRRGGCSFAGDDVLTSCLTSYAVGYPYVTGVGWAPSGKTWLLLQVDIRDDFHGAEHVTVAGVKPGHEIGDNAAPFSPFLVTAGAASYPVHGTATVDDLHRGSVRSALTGMLDGADQ